MGVDRRLRRVGQRRRAHAARLEHRHRRRRASPRASIGKLRELAKTKSSGFALWTHFFEPHSRYMEHAEFPVARRRAQGARGEIRRRGLVRRQVHRRGARRARGAGLDDRTPRWSSSPTTARRSASTASAASACTSTARRSTTSSCACRSWSASPGVAPRIVDGRSMLIDLGPTLVDLVKAHAPADAFTAARSLGAILGERARAARRSTPSCCRRPRGTTTGALLVDGIWKLIQKLSENTTELYDLTADPTEQHNLARRASAGEATRARDASCRRCWLGRPTDERKAG